MTSHEERIAVLEKVVKDLDRMYCVLLTATLLTLGAVAVLTYVYKT